MDLAVDLLACRVLTQITCCGNDDDAGVDKLFNLETKRVIGVGVDRLRSKTEVYDLNVVGCPICQDPIQTVQQPRRLARAVIIKNLHADNVRSGSDAAVSIVVDAFAAECQACHVRAVSVPVVGIRRRSKVHICDDPRITCRVLKSVVRTVDARVDDRYAYARSVAGRLGADTAAVRTGPHLLGAGGFFDMPRRPRRPVGRNIIH